VTSEFACEDLFTLILDGPVRQDYRRNKFFGVHVRDWSRDSMWGYGVDVTECKTKEAIARTRRKS
jgi:hypothetical protein